MPTSIDPQPTEDQVECARCGALIYYELSRCPKCGVNLYEPDDPDVYDTRDTASAKPYRSRITDKIGAFLRQITGKPYRGEQVFGDALDQASLYDDLLLKVGGDRAAVERLVDFERQQLPNGTGGSGWRIPSSAGNTIAGLADLRRSCGNTIPMVANITYSIAP